MWPGKAESMRWSQPYINTQGVKEGLRSSDPSKSPLPLCRLVVACPCSSSVCCNTTFPPSPSSVCWVSLVRVQWSSAIAMEVEACYNYGFLAADRGRHQPPPPPPFGNGQVPHPAEDGELWEYFPCPFCYIEVEVPFICNHLQEEHCFDTRNAVCPICANNLGKDMAAHFRVQHSHLLKRRKPYRPSSCPSAGTNSASGKGTATYQMSSYLEETEPQHYRMSSRPYQDPAPDPLLSQFICSVAQADNTVPSDANTKDGAVKIPDDQRWNKGANDEASSKVGLEERLQRIDFLTEILMSTII